MRDVMYETALVAGGCNPFDIVNGMLEGRYVYHGTSSNNVDSILKKGLVPGANKNWAGPTGRVYITRYHHIAGDEAKRTVDGEDDYKGVGGEPVVIKIDRLHPSFRSSKPYRSDDEWNDGESIHGTHAFHTTKRIPPEAIVSVDKFVS